MRPGPLLATILLVSLMAGAARAGSVTGESVWDRNNARQRALEQVPREATVKRTQCEEITVGTGNTRYRCTVFYSDPPARAPADPPAQPAS